jgi:hypothetical protein
MKNISERENLKIEDTKVFYEKGSVFMYRMMQESV